MIGLGAWLVSGSILFCIGLLAVVLRPRERRDWNGELTMVAGATMLAVALTRHEILDGPGLTLAVVSLLGGLALMIAIARRSEGDGR
jgi:hypothetical protein